MKLPGVDRLGSLGLVGERKALALLCLGFYSTLFFLVGLSARTELPECLPGLVMFALAPRGDQGMLSSPTAVLTLGCLALIGLSGLLLQRTWGVLVMAASGVACLLAAFTVTAPELSLTSAELFDGPFL